jgi:hypothetical protein
MERRKSQQRNLGVGEILGLRAHKLLILVLGLLTLGIVGGGVALATSDTAPPLAAPTAATVPAALAEHFAVLNEGTTGNAAVASIESAGISSSVVSRIDEMSQGLDEQFGLNSALAKEVTYGQQHVWVIPGSNGICIHDFETGEGTCGPIADAIAGTLTLDVGGNEGGVNGGGTIYGLVANGNPLIVAHDANGSNENVPVAHNVYIISHPGTTSVGLLNSTGQTQTVAVPR